MAELPHDLGGLTDVHLAQLGAHGRGDREEPRAQLAVARIPLEREAHELRSPVPRIVDELHESLGRQLIRQPLHALAAGWSHLGDLRHGKGTNQRQAAHESERTAAPARDEPCPLTNGPYSKEELCYFEHQVRDRLALARGDPTRRVPLSPRLHPVPLRRCSLTP